METTSTIRELNHREVSTTDRVARIKRTKAEWEALLAEFAHSGLSAAVFARQRGNVSREGAKARREAKAWPVRQVGPVRPVRQV